MHLATLSVPRPQPPLLLYIDLVYIYTVLLQNYKETKQLTDVPQNSRDSRLSFRSLI